MQYIKGKRPTWPFKYVKNKYLLYFYNPFVKKNWWFQQHLQLFSFVKDFKNNNKIWCAQDEWSKLSQVWVATKKYYSNDECCISWSFSLQNKLKMYMCKKPKKKCRFRDAGKFFFKLNSVILSNFFSIFFCCFHITADAIPSL